MTRFRLWRLRRAYRRIAKLEGHLMATPEGWGPAASMRNQFSTLTIRMIDTVYRDRGLGRQARQTLKRQMVKGRLR